MSEWLRAMGAGVANHLWQSTAFAAVVWGATLLLRKNAARVRYGLWVAASAKFLVPFSLLIGLGGMLPRPQHAVVTMPVYSAVDEVGLPFSEVETVPVAAVDPTHAAMRPRHEWGTPSAWLAGVWLGGVVVVLAVWCGGWRKVKRTLRRGVCADNDGREVGILRRVETAMGRRGQVGLVLSREWMEPGMFGIWRPVLIWPEGLSGRLDDEHVEAIMAHELMHARRRDNLTAALHMLVEAAFWFHPLAWWMERRMVEERERACDEAVVEMGSRPGVYAESLLKAVRFCVESPLVCVAGVTGADLAGRVRSIMTLRLKKLGVPGKVALAALAFIAIAGPVAFGIVRMIPLYGQILHAAGPLPTFEVATIRPLDTMHFTPPPSGGAPRVAPNGEQIISQQEVRISNAAPPAASNMVNKMMTAKMLIGDAYNLPAFSKAQIVGGPDWTEQTMYRIEAKIDDTEYAAMQQMPSKQQVQQVRLMEQSLLAERFRLKVHFETREVPVYALEVAKGGAKLTPAKTDSAAAGDPAGSAQAHPAVMTITGKGDGFEIKGKAVGPGQLILLLQQQPELGNRMVVDQTGLTGHYDLSMDWTREASAAADARPEAAGTAPPFFTALKEELGLQLVESKGPVEVIVIDRIEKPSVDGAEIPHAIAPFSAAAMASPLPAPISSAQQDGATAGGTQALHGGYQAWLDQDVRWLISPGERSAFLGLVDDRSRDDFIEHFWERKGSEAGMSGKAYKAELYTRIAYANENFASGQPGWMTDMGHVYIVYGKPDEIVTQPGYETQSWWYRHLPGVGNNVVLKFVDASGKRDYRLATPMPQPGTASSSPLAAFDVASVKPSSPAGREINGAYTYPGGRFECIGCTVQYLVMLAFDAQSWQIAGGPDWTNISAGARYDIEAKPPESSPATALNNPVKKTPPNAEQRQMLQSLLLDRFQLKFHVEKGEGAVYILSRGNKPLKLLPPKDPAGFHWAGSPGGGAIVNGSGMAGTNISMPELAGRLGGFLRRPVLDQTGLAGTYDFEYRTGNEDQDSDKTVGIISSLREIGLNLAPGKGPVDTVVIDHVERPSEN